MVLPGAQSFDDIKALSNDWKGAATTTIIHIPKILRNSCMDRLSRPPFLNLFSWSTPSETQYKLINPREMDSLLSNTEVVNIIEKSIGKDVINTLGALH